jgi:hypothetical protein
MEVFMEPNAIRFLEQAGITMPLIGFYDEPDTKPYESITVPQLDKRKWTFSGIQTLF